MLIVKLKGGLGNQLFQYAFGRALSLRNEQSLILDITHFDAVRSGETPRDYRLHHYAISAKTEVPQAARKLLRMAKKNKLMKSSLVRSLFEIRSITEKGFEYRDIEPARASRGIWYYDGYWQAPRYFEEIRQTLLQELTPVVAAEDKNAETLGWIKNSSAVSLHVRRGDYVANPAANAFHGLCGLDYYRAAMDHMEKLIASPTYYVFSDDIGWARENIRTRYPTVFVEHNDDRAAHEDLRLMSQCHHHIIANSSFSWWGAWLSPNPDKKVIAPKRWFLDDSMNCTDLIPSSWIRM